MKRHIAFAAALFAALVFTAGLGYAQTQDHSQHGKVAAPAQVAKAPAAEKAPARNAGATPAAPADKMAQDGGGMGGGQGMQGMDCGKGGGQGMHGMQGMGGQGMGMMMCPMMHMCMMQGMMAERMMMMHGGMGGPMMGGAMMKGAMAAPAKVLSADEAKARVEGWIKGTSNPNLKVGNVTEDGSDFVVEVVTVKEGALVDKMKVNKETGWMRSIY